ncbi:MAG: hypothetical protein ACRDO8_12535 [Nocardioidaceae bacterium]
MSLRRKAEVDMMAPDETLDPRRAMEMLESTSRESSRALRVDEGLLFGVWGVAWLVGYGATYLSVRGQDPYTGPAAWAYAVMAAGFGLAVVVTTVVVTRATRGVLGASATTGMLYGLSWPVAFATLFLLEGALARAGAPDEVLGLVGAGGPALVVGVIYLVGSAIWRSVTMFALGVWLCLAMVVGSYLGVVALPAIMAVAGGAGFLVAGAARLPRTRR